MIRDILQGVNSREVYYAKTFFGLIGIVTFVLLIWSRMVECLFQVQMNLAKSHERQLYLLIL